MRRSEKLGALALALAKAQCEIENATLNRVNPHFKSKYADLASIRDAVIPAMARHGLAVTQIIATTDGREVVETVLLHESGEWLSSECPIKADKPGPQPFGSALTYARRYALAAIGGIAAEEDDDADAAQGPAKSSKAPAKPKDDWTPPSEPALIQVPQDDEKKADWKTWAGRIVAAIDAAPTVEAVNSLMELNEPPLKNLEAAKKETVAFIKDRAEKRRGLLAQKPEAA